MDALLRQQYLQAMGTRLWVPRFNLPGAPESRLCELPTGVVALTPQELVADKPPQAEQRVEKSPTTGATPNESKRESISARLKLDLDSASVGKRAAPRPQAKTRSLVDAASSSATSPVHSSVLSFNLVLCRLADSELLVAELPAGSDELRVPWSVISCFHP